MATLADLKAEVLAEALWGIVYDESSRQEGITTQHTFQYFPKDTPLDTGKHDSDLSWLLSVDIWVDNEGEAGESAYYRGLWLGPLHNAYLRWYAANIAPPLYTHSETWVDNETMRFVECDVSSGYIDSTHRIGSLSGGELVVT